MSEPFQKVAVNGFIRDGNRFLITRRSSRNDWKPGEWDIPGGTVEFGEVDPTSALSREIFEETGLRVGIGKLLHLYSSVTDSRRHQFQIIYDCEFLGGEIRLNPEEHDGFQWVSEGETDGLPLIAFLKDYMDRIPSSKE